VNGKGGLIWGKGKFAHKERNHFLTKGRDALEGKIVTDMGHRKEADVFVVGGSRKS